MRAGRSRKRTRRHPPANAWRAQDPTGEAASEAQKQLTFYELDLGLNHVTRKDTFPVDNGSNLLISVPGGADGPGERGGRGGLRAGHRVAPPPPRNLPAPQTPHPPPRLC